MANWIEINIHDYAAIRLAENAPTASLFTDMFEPFIAKGLPRYDLTITGEFEPLAGGAFGEAHGETEFHYTATGLNLDVAKVQIVRSENGFHLNGKSELLVWALPLIDQIMVAKGAAMIHALTVEYRGHGLCMPAWGGTGKTSTMAKRG